MVSLVTKKTVRAEVHNDRHDLSLLVLLGKHLKKFLKKVVWFGLLRKDFLASSVATSASDFT